MMRVMFFLLAVGLAVYALVDIASSDEQQRGSMPKALWYIVVIFVPILGPLAWLLVRRAAANRYRGPSSGGTRSRPVAPDDDPEFLWKLDQQRRREQGDDGPRP